LERKNEDKKNVAKEDEHNIQHFILGIIIGFCVIICRNKKACDTADFAAWNSQ